MKRHAFDPISFIAGLGFAAVAAVYLASDRFDWSLDGRWIVPVVLISLGAAGLIGALLPTASRHDADDVDEVQRHRGSG